MKNKTIPGYDSPEAVIIQLSHFSPLCSSGTSLDSMTEVEHDFDWE